MEGHADCLDQYPASKVAKNNFCQPSREGSWHHRNAHVQRCSQNLESSPVYAHALEWSLSGKGSLLIFSVCLLHHENMQGNSRCASAGHVLVQLLSYLWVRFTFLFGYRSWTHLSEEALVLKCVMCGLNSVLIAFRLGNGFFCRVLCVVSFPLNVMDACADPHCAGLTGANHTSAAISGRAGGHAVSNPSLHDSCEPFGCDKEEADAVYRPSCQIMQRSHVWYSSTILAILVDVGYHTDHDDW